MNGAHREPALLIEPVPRSLVLGIFAFALLVRLGYCFVAIPVLGLSAGPGNEAFYYTDGFVNLAQNLLEYGKLAFTADAAPTTYRAPAHPLFLAALSRIVGDIGAAQLVLNSISSALAVALSYLCATMIIGRGSRLAWIAGIVLPISIHYCASGFADTFYSFTVCLYAYTLLRLVAEPRPGAAVLHGVTYAFTSLTKAVLLPFPVVFALYLWVRNRKTTGLWLVAMLIGLALIAPWSYRNYRVSGQFIPVTHGFGYGVLMGNHMAAKGPDIPASTQYSISAIVRDLSKASGRSWSFDELRTGGYFEPSIEVDRMSLGIAVEQFRDHPSSLVRKVLVNSYRFWCFSDSARKSLILAFMHFPLLLLAGFGLWKRWSRARAMIEPLVLLAVAFMGTYAIIIVHSVRYALPLLMLAAPLAGQGLADVGASVWGSWIRSAGPERPSDVTPF